MGGIVGFILPARVTYLPRFGREVPPRSAPWARRIGLSPSRSLTLPGLGLRVGDEPNLHALSKSSGDSSKHGEGMTLVVVVLEAADHGVLRSDKLGELSLGDSCFLAKSVDLARDLGVRSSLLECSSSQ